MKKKYIVKLTKKERGKLKKLISTGQTQAYKQMRARILLKADEAHNERIWADEEIAEAVEISVPTVERIRKKFVMEGFEKCLCNNQHSSRPKNVKIDGEAEAHLVALSCSSPPKGRSRWTLRLLAERMVELSYVESVSHEAIRQTLKKTNLSPGKRRHGA